MGLEIVAVLIAVGLACAIMLNSASIQRGVTIGGKTFTSTASVTGTQAQSVEASVAAATAATMTAQAQTSKSLTTATFSAGVATYTTSATHGYVIGQVVVIAGVSPSGWNGNFVVTGVPTTTTFTVALGVDPGAYVSGGTVTSYNTLTCTAVNPFLATNKIDIYSGTTTVVVERSCVVQVVVGLSVGYNGGAGSVPANATPLAVNIPTQLALNFTGNSLQCYAEYGDAVSNFRYMASDGTTEIVNETPQLAGYVKIWDVHSPTVNPFAGVTNGSVYVSHKDTTGAKLCRVGVVVS